MGPSLWQYVARMGKGGADWLAYQRHRNAGVGDALTVENGGPAIPCPVNDAGTSRCPTGYGSSAQDGAGMFDELNVSGNPNIGHFQKTFFRQFDTSKFSVPPMNVRGNSGLGTEQFRPE